MWEHHLGSLLGRAWDNLLLALSSSTLSVIVFSLAVPTCTFFATLIAKISRARKAGSSVSEILKGTITPTAITAGITGLCWICLFGWSVAATIYKDHQDLVSAIPRARTQQSMLDQSKIDELNQEIDRLEKRTPEEKLQCWSQNITLPAPRNQPDSVKSASEVVVFCNKERRAPLTVVVTYDKSPMLAGPIAFPEGRILKTTEYFQGSKLFFALDSPSMKPYQFFIVTVYGDSEVPPMSKSVEIAETNPEK